MKGIRLYDEQENKQYNHWNYFIALERDLENISRYVEFNKDNYDTYSIELAHLFLAVSSEVDVVLSSLCKLVNPNGVHKGIFDYQKTIGEYIPDLLTEQVYFPRYGFTIKPFGDWNKQENLEWWTSYNKVKHHRNTDFKKANLKNALYSVSALGIIVLYYYKVLLSKEKENEIPFDKITSKFQQKTSLTRFNGKYYYVNIAVMGS